MKGGTRELDTLPQRQSDRHSAIFFVLIFLFPHFLF